MESEPQTQIIKGIRDSEQVPFSTSTFLVRVIQMEGIFFFVSPYSVSHSFCSFIS